MKPMKNTFALAVAAIAASQAWSQTPADARAAPDETRTLRPVVVTPTPGVAQEAFDTPASVDVVDRETLRNSQLQVNLSEPLVRVPGVIALNRQNYAQDLQISIRGFGARSTFGVRGIRLYLDGIPATAPDWLRPWSPLRRWIPCRSVRRLDELEHRVHACKAAFQYLDPVNDVHAHALALHQRVAICLQVAGAALQERGDPLGGRAGVLEGSVGPRGGHRHRRDRIHRGPAVRPDRGRHAGRPAAGP